MKPIAIASLALFLSGCASSTSVDELDSRVRQLEYEICLDNRMDFWKMQTSEGISERALRDCADKLP